MSATSRRLILGIGALATATPLVACGSAGPGSVGRRVRPDHAAERGGGVGQAVAAGTTLPDEAWELLKFMMTPEALTIELVNDQLNMPRRKSLANSKEYVGTGRPPKSIKVFVEGLPSLRVDPQTTNWGEIEAAINRELAPLWAGEKSARDAALAVKRAIDPLLQQAEAKRRL